MVGAAFGGLSGCRSRGEKQQRGRPERAASSGPRTCGLVRQQARKLVHTGLSQPHERSEQTTTCVMSNS